jgi:hypothetical protein
MVDVGDEWYNNNAVIEMMEYGGTSYNRSVYASPPYGGSGVPFA